MLHASIVILNYNGEMLLPVCLPSIVEAVRQSIHSVQIVLLDNMSTDQGLNYAAHAYPQVKIWPSPRNRYLCSYNDYLAASKESIAILLNNDIRVEPGFIDPLLEPFQKDPSTFLVAPQVKSFDGESIEAAKTVSRLKFGIFWASARYPGYEREAHIPSKTFSSGFGAVSRELFLKLGGYDDRYLPGIFEDIDLCYRAKHAGYSLYYEPRSIVYHMGQASFKKVFGSYRIACLAHRNNFFFMWKNFHGLSFWLQHLFWLPARLLFALLRGNIAFIHGFWIAWTHKISVIKCNKSMPQRPAS